MPAELRRAAVYALARRPKKEALPALRAELRTRDGERGAGRRRVVGPGAGLLGDAESVPDLVRLADSANVSVAVQSLARPREDPLFVEGRGACGRRRRASRRGGRTIPCRAWPLPPSGSRARSARGRFAERCSRRICRRGGWRGQTALVSLTRLDAPGDPGRAARRLADAAASRSLELKLGACEALEFLPPDIAERVGAALLADSSPRVRAAALSSLSKKAAPNRDSRISPRGLSDPSPSVRAAALEASAPLVDGAAALAAPSWSRRLREELPRGRTRRRRHRARRGRGAGRGGEASRRREGRRPGAGRPGQGPARDGRHLRRVARRASGGCR